MKRACDFTALLRQRGLSPTARRYRVVAIRTARWVMKRRRSFTTDDVPRSIRGDGDRDDPSLPRYWVREMLSSWEEGEGFSHSALADQILVECPQLNDKVRKHWKGQ